MQLENAFVEAPIEPPATKTSFIDLTDLEECLRSYFDGSIDQIDLSRLWLPVSQLVPGKPLLSQIDSEMMAEALGELPDVFAVAIAHHYQPTDIDLLEWLMRSFVQSGAEDFASFCYQAYVDGLAALGEIVRRKL